MENIKDAIELPLAPQCARKAENMNIGHYIGYINLTALIALAALAYLKYKKYNRKIYAATAAGAAVLIIHWWLRINPAIVEQAPWTAGVVEILGILALLGAAMTEDKTINPRTLIIATLPVLIFITLLGFMSVFISNIEDVLTNTIPVVALLAALAGFIAAWQRNIPSPHYCVQAFMFLTVSAAARLIGSAAPGHHWAAPAAAAAAAFAYLSLIIYIETLSDEQTAPVSYTSDEPRDDELLIHTCNEIARSLKELEASASSETWFATGLNIISNTLRNRLGYKHISIALWDGSPRNTNAVSGFLINGGITQTEADIALTSEVMARIAKENEIIISDNLRDDTRLAGCSFEGIEWNSAAIIPLPSNAAFPACALIIADRADGSVLQYSDLRNLEQIMDSIGLFFSYMTTRGELSNASGIDPVTLRFNYSSFQKTLALTMEESDKTGGTFALALFDVDKFVFMNEKLGFERGDQVLRGIGDAISQIAKTEHVARVGPDEFALILKGDTEHIRGELETILDKLRGLAGEICPEMSLSLSVAYTLYPFDFLEQTSVFGKMREALVPGSSSMGQLLRVKCN